MKSSLCLLALAALLVSCGHRSDTGYYTCKSSPFLADSSGKNRCRVGDAVRFDGEIGAFKQTVWDCEVLNNDSKDCREACVNATSCFY